MLIKCNGQEIDTIHFRELTDQEFVQLRNELYKKPEIAKVQKQFKDIAGGTVQNSFITDYYVKDLMYKTRVYYNKWSIEEALNCKELLGHFVAKTEKNKDVYPDSLTLAEKVETAFRLGGKGIATKPANFPIKTVDEILTRYNPNNNYYDFSCGWGARLTSALKNKINYYGTDPNYLLTDRLKQLSNDYQETVNQNTLVDIRSQGSEIFVSEWENKIGVAFSSPPYFYLEDYRVGNQSWHTGVTYKEWKEKYLEPTIQNIYKYLINNGYFILNINNFLDFDLVGDSKKIAQRNGFVYIGDHQLENISRINCKKEFNDNNEKIMVFMKDTATNIDQAKIELTYGYNKKRHFGEISLF